jgi:hypothetical protein
MRWYGHVLRMNEERMPENILNINVKVKYPRRKLK